MKIETKYNRIERVTYEFDEHDIERALIEMAKIKYQRGHRVVFEMLEEGATVTVIYETPLDQQETTSNER